MDGSSSPLHPPAGEATPDRHPADPIIAIEHLSKSFDGVSALSDVSLTFGAGAVHGLLGENGAGKSTLMNILFGLERADRGVIRVAGRAVVIGSSRRAQELGIGMVHQHFKLVPSFSVSDNLALALAPGLGLIDLPRLHARIADQAARLGWTIDFAAPVRSLSVGEQQRIEILKALTAGPAASLGRGILILDEPTAVLSPGEVDDFLAAVRALAAAGTTVLLISHKLHEVERCCDTITILRRGLVVHSGPARSISREQMAAQLIGGQLPPDSLPARASSPPGPARISIDGLVVERPGGLRLLDGASVQVASGEIVGIAGIDGNGQAELAQVILGLLPASSGTVSLAGGLDQLGVIPDDRHAQALVLPLSLTENLALRTYKRPPLAWAGWLRLQAWREQAQRLASRYDVRAASLAQSVEELSGGNQQKLVVARELSRKPAMILAINPTRGLDIRATSAVLGHLLEARAGGAGVLLIHSDLDELLAVSDRVLVLHGGRLTPSRWPSSSREAIGRMMLGLAEGAA
jgi:simple sugar transport system ATP-binding protein